MGNFIGLSAIVTMKYHLQLQSLLMDVLLRVQETPVRFVAGPGGSVSTTQVVTLI